jgi:hypothetical protein
MSFYSGNRLPNFPGPLTGNPLIGLCEKACISTKKVFDLCLKQMQENNVQVTAFDFTPANPVFPLTFVSTSNDPDLTTISNLTVNRLDDKPCFARVTCDVNIPLTISYTDANGVSGTARAKLVVNEDVVLYVPQPSMIPTTIEATASLISPDGEFVGGNVFCLDFCLSILLKVSVNAEILVPTYGYCPVPHCQDFTQDACGGFFDLPLFPAQQPVQNCNV